MQQTFQCYGCGAANYVGQLACRSCGYQFYYYCPICNVVVNPNFVICHNCGNVLPWSTSRQGAHSLHILSLDTQNKRLLGLLESGSSETLLIAVTSDGRISTLPVKDRAEFYRLQKDVENSLKKNEFLTICVAVVSALRENPTHPVLVYKVISGNNCSPYIKQIYGIYDGLFQWTTNRISNRVDNCLRIDETFRAEPMRSMINALIGNLRHDLNWDELVEHELVYRAKRA